LVSELFGLFLIQGKCKVVKNFDHPCILVVGAGITLHEALKASNDLEKENYHL
jgi:transketolase C-terminal domain/subunit